MPHQKKYTEGTANRTMTFLKKDLDILQAHTGYRETLTDLVQQAIKEYIKRNGWDQEEPGTKGEGEPNKRDPIDMDPPGQPEPEKPDDRFDGLPDYLKTD